MIVFDASTVFPISYDLSGRISNDITSITYVSMNPSKGLLSFRINKSVQKFPEDKKGKRPRFHMYR